MEVQITHPEKIYWPENGYTKEDLVTYYQTVGSTILPHLKDRPIMLHRYPNGISGEDFFQKDAPTFTQSWLKRVKIEHEKKIISYIVISNIESLLFIANLGTIEIHPFLSRYPHIGHPDFLVLDIDPASLEFAAAIEVAKTAHKMLDQLHIPHYCKTSGKRGLHIYIPLQAHYEYELIENFSKLLANFIHDKMPDITSLVRDPKKRQKKVYIDYLQNGRTKTVVAPYSVRGIENAPISTPLEWKEVKKGLDPQYFTIATLPKRIQKKGDLFAPVLGKGINIQDVLAQIESHSKTFRLL